MTPRYFKSESAVWKFTNDGNFCRSLLDAGKEWREAVSCIEDMAGDHFTEIAAEEGEPGPQEPTCKSRLYCYRMTSGPMQGTAFSFHADSPEDAFMHAQLEAARLKGKFILVKSI